MFRSCHDKPGDLFCVAFSCGCGKSAAVIRFETDVLVAECPCS
jgi:hypothetical protein